MSLFSILDVSGSALTAQSQRLNTTASNLANADSATTSTGQPYRAKQVVFTAQPVTPDNAVGVRVSSIVEDQTPGRRVHDPRHPLADKDGYVSMPNVNVIEEMVNMISASRSYQTNAELMNTAKTLLLKTLQIGQ
ncbi:MAG: flagellar basal-body rod protein FlgC [Betaproteobacteria bacterium]|jgi:flagellar basal-body rod protein FlgC|nr:flagellar basal-body rod protein FlgC [Betaproteobacteria bacterium]